MAYGDELPDTPICGQISEPSRSSRFCCCRASVDGTRRDPGSPHRRLPFG